MDVRHLTHYTLNLGIFSTFVDYESRAIHTQSQQLTHYKNGTVD